MDHIAIDLGGRESQVCIRRPDGTIARETRVRTKDLPMFLMSQTSPCRVIVETCSEAFAVTDAARSAGHDGRVVPTTLVKTLGVGARRTKSDKRDAQVLSEVSTRIELPSVHVPSALSRKRKSQCKARDALVQARTQLINSVRGYARTQIRQTSIRSGTPATFPERIRKALPDMPIFLARLLLVIESLNEQIKQATQELAVSAQEEELCRRFMTVPGVGPVTATLFAAVIDDVKRFPSANKVEAYLGLTPGEHSSSDRERRTSITKAGNASLRCALVQAAWAARRRRGDHPVVQWSLEIEKRRGKRIAVVALARKIAGILFALWRDGSTYEARRSTASTPTT